MNKLRNFFRVLLLYKIQLFVISWYSHQSQSIFWNPYIGKNEMYGRGIFESVYVIKLKEMESIILSCWTTHQHISWCLSNLVLILFCMNYVNSSYYIVLSLSYIPYDLSIHDRFFCWMSISKLFSKKNVKAVNRKRFYDLKMEMEIISENIKLSKVNLKADQTRFRFSYVIT